MGDIKAITFDLWDTLVIDDSDEAKRAEQGLRSKFDERRHLLWEALNTTEPIELETVRLAYNVGDAAFNKVWKEQHITWHIAERLRVILNGLGRELPDEIFNAVVRAHEEMEVDIPPDAMPDAVPVLALSQTLQTLHRLGRHRVTRELPAATVGESRLSQVLQRICLLR